MIYATYRTLTTICAPLIARYLKNRLKKGKEHPERFSERLGIAAKVRPEGVVIWMHGASVGEAVSLLPLISVLRKDYPAFHILMTTGTITSANLMEKRLPDGVIHQFVPVDRLPYVRRFLDHWKPDFAIWSESELWPNLICETHKRAIKMVLINARMSETSLKNWQRFPNFAKQLISSFDLCLAQTERDGAHYRSLGAKSVLSVGNLKFAADDLPYDVTAFNELRSTCQDRKMWMGASTHAGEEVEIAQAHGLLKRNHPDLLTLIAPRHPERGLHIYKELQTMGFSCALRSRGDEINEKTEIYICDTLGELGLFYRLVPIVFVGKSLSPLGGQNPLEPARLNSALLSGPYMDNFAEMMDAFTKGNAIQIVKDRTDFVRVLSQLLEDDNAVKGYAERALSVSKAQGEVLYLITGQLKPYLDQLG